MLPFTKRPGRGDESGESDVVTRDDLETADVAVPVSKRNVASTSAAASRPKFDSLSDEEMTNIMPSKSIVDALESARAASPRPAAGAPPPSRASVAKAAPSSRSAGRSGKFVTKDDEEEGRTVVRGGPRIVKRTNAPSSKMGMPTSPTTVSPAAVIKATLESARAGASMKRTGDHLMAGPPVDLLEDLADRVPTNRPRPADVEEHTAILQTTGTNLAAIAQGAQALSPQSVSLGSLPPGSTRPNSQPNFSPEQSGGYAEQGGGYAQQSGGYAQQSGGYAQQSGGYPAQYDGPAPAASGSVPGVALPPHFMMAQAPYSDARMDPPGTAVTARTKITAGRPATSWALALVAFGLFVGLGAFATLRGNGGGFLETSASFVDPSRASSGKAAAAAPTQAPVPVPVAPEAAANAGVPPVAAPAAEPAATAPVVAVAPPVTAAPPPVAAAPPPVVAAPVVRAPVVAAAPVIRPAAPPVRPVVKPASEDPPVKPAAAAKAGKPGKPGAGDSAVDEEQKKALKALQESQLETPF